MGDLKNAKMFGGIGSILMLVGAFIPFVGMLLPIVGLVLVFIAIKNIADVAKDNSIFTNYLYYFILNIVAVVAVFVIAIVLLGATLSGLGLSYTDLLTQTSGETIDPNEIFSNFDFMALIGGCLIALAVAWIIMIIAAIFLRKSFASITEHTKVGLFATTGLIYLIGAATIIIAIGLIIILIAEILQIVAFFSLPDTLPTAQQETI